MARARVKPPDGLIDPENVPTKFLAEVLGLSVVRISQLASEGVLYQNGNRGKYNLVAAVNAYLTKFKHGSAKSAKERLAIQQERKIKLQNDREEKKVAEIEQAAEVFVQCCNAMRSALSALPRRVSSDIAGRAALQDAIEEAVADFEKPIREYFALAGQDLSLDSAGSGIADAEGKAH